MSKSKSTTADHTELKQILRARFEKNAKRHKGISWADVEARLAPEKLRVLDAMEASGGEPDVVGRDAKSGAILFFDCATETPSGRRSLCYDDAALEARKEHKPAGSAVGMAEEMGVELLTEDDYRKLQSLGAFDLKTSSWLLAPAPIRKLGGAIFGDRRYDTVFIYHNGVQSYYAGRGFRGKLWV